MWVSSFSSTPSDQQFVLDAIIQCYNSLLSSNYYTIRHVTVTSLVQFAKHISNTSHKSVLPKCIPKQLQLLLQCRLQNTIYHGEINNNPTIIDDVHLLKRKYTNDFMMYMINTSKSSNRDISTKRRKIGIPILPTSNIQSYSIPTGSYCMTMPTQDGRNAIVLFPPGQQSIDDIHCMMNQSSDVGMDNEDKNITSTTNAVINQIRNDIRFVCSTYKA